MCWGRYKELDEEARAEETAWSVPKLEEDEQVEAEREAHEAEELVTAGR
jgi:hypothetical protein